MKSDFDTTVRLLTKAIQDLAKQRGVDAKEFAQNELAKQKKDAVARGESPEDCDKNRERGHEEAAVISRRTSPVFSLWTTPLGNERPKKPRNLAGFRLSRLLTCIVIYAILPTSHLR
jgi:hypothetical protein